MAEHLLQISILGEILPIPAAKRLDCGMTPDSCGFYKYEGGTDHMCERRIAADLEALQRVREQIALFTTRPVEPMVLCGVIREG